MIVAGGLGPTVDDVTRALPHALGPEKSLLSSMLQDPQEYIGVAIGEKLTTEHFYLPAHSTLYGFLIEPAYRRGGTLLVAADKTSERDRDI